MLLVVETQPGVVELAYTWLPTWLGMNAALKLEIEKEFSARFVGRSVSLEEMHEAVIDHICGLFPEIDGLRAYLKAVEQVRGPEHDGQEG